MLEFSPISNAAAAPGLVLRLGNTNTQYLRVTHVFSSCIYFMRIGEPEQARFARRPSRWSILQVQELVASPDACWGRVVLPASLSNPPLPESSQAQELDTAWALIEPLVVAFNQEQNLHRLKFSAFIRERVEATGTSFTTVLRTLLRYYYFGGSRLALLPLPPGVKPGTPAYTQIETKGSAKFGPKRRGRKPILANELGENDFVVSELDIGDMVDCLKACLRRGVTSIAGAHEHYLTSAFRLRHPDLYKEYISFERPEPVSRRQFKYYIDNNARLSDDLSANLRLHSRGPGYLGSLYAAGPGEVYEIDSTGGRIYLVTKDEDGKNVVVGKPTIYLIVDRWSRFIVSAYLSLRPPSYEEVRHALLVAFTSRERRFGALGVVVDDKQWPIGRMPAVICPDRGSDFLSSSMEKAVVDDLKIELTPLPPYCPDGKAVVERLIREVKRRMAASGMKGVYAERPMDPETKHAAKKAEAVAVHSLGDAYRLLIDIAVDHNNRPHSKLKQRRLLTQAGVRPTPKDAYQWGLKNISGLRIPPFNDADYKRLLLASDLASVANGVLRYKKRAYLPANEAAIEIMSNSTRRARQVSIRLDRTDPAEVFIVTQRGTWAAFQITRGGESEMAGLTLDEDDALSSHNALLWARSEHESRVGRVAAKSQKAAKKAETSRTPAEKVEKAKQNSLRKKETASMKRNLVGSAGELEESLEDDKAVVENDWTKYEEEERLRNLELIRKHRSRQ